MRHSDEADGLLVARLAGVYAILVAYRFKVEIHGACVPLGILYTFSLHSFPMSMVSCRS